MAESVLGIKDMENTSSYQMASFRADEGVGKQDTSYLLIIRIHHNPSNPLVGSLR